MSILLDGGSNPARVRFNGTEIRKVVFNGVTVWGGNYPARLSNFSLKTPGNDWFPNGFTFSASSLGYGEMQNLTVEPYQTCVYGDGFRGSGTVSNGKVAFKLPSSNWLSIAANRYNGTAISDRQGGTHIATGNCTISGVPSGFTLSYLQVWAYPNLPCTSGTTTIIDQFLISLTYYGAGRVGDSSSFFVMVEKPSDLYSSYVQMLGTGASFSVTPTRFHVELEPSS